MCFDEEPDDPCAVCREKSLAALDKLRLERDALDKLATQRATEVNRLTHELSAARKLLSCEMVRYRVPFQAGVGVWDGKTYLTPHTGYMVRGGWLVMCDGSGKFKGYVLGPQRESELLATQAEAQAWVEKEVTRG